MMKCQRGSTILEYTIVFPVVLLAVMLVVFSGYLLHQKATMDAAVQRGALKAARLFADPRYDDIAVESGPNMTDKIDVASVDSLMATKAFDDLQPYRYVFMNKDAFASIQTDVEKYIGKTQLFGKGNLTVDDVVLENHVFYQKVIVSASQDFMLPQLVNWLNLPPILTIHSSAVTIINDPDEFIRNADLVVDIIAEIGSRTGLTDKITTMFKKVSDAIGKFFSQ